MKFFKLITSLLKNWTVLLTLVSVLGFAYCGFVDQGQRTDYTWSASTGIADDTQEEGGRVSASGGTSYGGGGSRPKRLILETQDDDPNPDVEIDVEDYLEQVAFFYQVWGRCTAQTHAASLKRCYLNNCLQSGQNPDDTPAGTFRTCKTQCENSNSNCDLISAGHASGFFYDTDKVLTNRHVIDRVLTYNIDSNGVRDDGAYNGPPGDPKESEGSYFSIISIFENYRGDFELVTSIDWHDKDSDVALAALAGDMPRIDTVTLGSLSDVSLLLPVFTIGNPLSERWIASKGYITKESSDDTIYHSIEIYEGNSGGGIFDLETGKIVGIIHSYLLTGRPEYRRFYSIGGLGTHVDKIKELIASNPGGPQTGQQVQTQAFFEDMSSDDRTQAYRMVVEHVQAATD